MPKIPTKIVEKVVKMIGPLTISLVKQPSPKLQKKTHSSTNDLIIPSLRKEPLSDQQMKQREFELKEKDYKTKERDQELKEMDYELKKKQTVLTVVGLAAPTVTAIVTYQNLKNNAQGKDKEAKINKLEAQLSDSEAQANEFKAQDAKSQAELNRYKKQEEDRLKQSENSLYNKVFGSSRR